MEVSFPIMESGTHARVHEEKMMMCSYNRQDIEFDDANSKMHGDKLMICGSNCGDSAFHMEVSPSNGNDGKISDLGRDGVVGLKGNDEEVLGSGCDSVVGLNGNDGEVSNLGCDGVLGLKGNDGEVSNLGCDGVLGLKGNDEEVLSSGCDGVVCLKGNDGVVSNFGYDGVVCWKGNNGVVSNLGCLNGNDGVVSSLGHNGVVGLKGNNGELLESDCDGVVGFKGNNGVVSSLGHDGVVGWKGNERDVDVDIVNNGNVDEERLAEMDIQDGTESSSSFGCTNDSGDGSAELSSDSEVESHFQDDKTSFLRSRGFSDLVRTRKKKLTAHWRKFIRPLMWRCKWVELQLRELHSQARKYDKELSECKKRKRSQLDKCAIEELGLKSTPFNGQYRSVNLMKRKKRKRVEETVDLASYTSRHNLFSYYVSRRSFTDSLYMDDDPGNTDVSPAENSPFGNNELGITFESNSCDAFESILRKIEDAQLRARQLRIRMDKVVRENAGKFTASSSAPGDQYAKSTGPNSLSCCVNPEKVSPGSVLAPSQQMSEKKLVMPESVVHGSGRAEPPLNVVKRTEPAQTGGKIEKMELQTQTHSQQLPEQLPKSEEVDDRPIVESQMVTEVPNSNGITPVNEEQASNRRIGSKLITPRNKRKRGRRKAVSARWSKKSSG